MPETITPQIVSASPDMDPKVVAEQRTRAMFKNVAQEAGMIEGAIDLGFPVAGLEPTIAPNYAKTLARVEGMKKTHPFLFDPGRGSTPVNTASAEIIPDNDIRLQDSAWVMANYDAVVASAKAKIASGQA
jgi:hypothetical protein